jgi:hypothetical protein
MLGLLLLVTGLLSGFASNTVAKDKPKSSVRTITGCLSKGEDADEYLLTANDGSTWEIRSTQVPLADHVGHTVAVRGVVAHSKMHNLKEDAKETAKDTGVKKSDAEHGHLKPTSVKMVANSCTR